MVEETDGETLLQGYLDGSLDAAGCRQLRSLLEGEPALARRIVADLRTDALIRETLQQHAVEEVARRTGEGTATVRRTMRPAPARRWRGPAWMPWAVAATLLVGVVLLAVVRTVPATPADAGRFVVRVEAGAGRALRGATARTLVAGLTVAADERIVADRALRIAAGSSVFTLEPGTELAVTDRFHAVCAMGTMAVTVDGQAPADGDGVRQHLHTPCADIRVTGTRFTVTVGADATLLHLAEGRLEMANAHGHVALTAGGVAEATIRSVPILHPSRPAGPLAPVRGALLGAYSEISAASGPAARIADLAAREALLGRRFAIHHSYVNWSDPFPDAILRDDAAHGRIPLITWHGSRTVALDRVLAGEQDALITARARTVTAFGRPLFLRLSSGVNGDWKPWNASHQSDPGTRNGAVKFIAAWRHIHRLFRLHGATNAVWVWGVNWDDSPYGAWNHWQAYYPGDDVVDWVGIDAYNWGPDGILKSWYGPERLLRRVYDDYAMRKPIMLAELASVEEGGDKAAWMVDLLRLLPSRFPAVAAVVWHDQAMDRRWSWSIDSSPAASEAFRRLAADPFFNPHR